MTEQEKIIISAYTGYLLCDFGKVHEYIEKKIGRPVWTHEMAFENIEKEIREKCRDDFVTLAREDHAEPKKGKWEVTPMYIKCSECGESFMLIPQNFCPNCGADMRGGD